jgi:hypothetical protein
MLRRAPTAISLTSEDLAAYEDARAARLSRLARAAANDSQSTQPNTPRQEEKRGPVDPSDELKPLPGDQSRMMRIGEGRGREERIMGMGR